MIFKDLKWKDGTPFNPPENPLKEKWKEKYPKIPDTLASQVCDGYSCMWCGRCPDGDYWKVPEEDKEAYDKYKAEYDKYIDSHGGIENLNISVDLKKYFDLKEAYDKQDINHNQFFIDDFIKGES